MVIRSSGRSGLTGGNDGKPASERLPRISHEQWNLLRPHGSRSHDPADTRRVHLKPALAMLPTIEVKVGELLVDAIVRIGFAASKREARYFITHGAVRLGRWVRLDSKPDAGATVVQPSSTVRP